MQQSIQAHQQVQLPLFEAFLAQPVLPGLKASEQARKSSRPELFSELSCVAPPNTARACWRRYCVS